MMLLTWGHSTEDIFIQPVNWPFDVKSLTAQHHEVKHTTENKHFN